MTMVRQTCPSAQDKNEDAHDLISQLPAAICESIFSLLSLKEAAATSIICRRWQHMWESSTRILDFLDETLCCFRLLNSESRDQKRRSYVDWVDQLVEQHTGPTIEQFKARFYLDHRFTSSIDKWVLFALKKRTQVLVLDFVFSNRQDPYTFPCKLLGLEKGSPGHAGFKSLKALHLTNVSMTGEVLECLLSNCQVLERLTVISTRNLYYIRIVGPSNPLKYLVIATCFDLKSIEIREANLVSFSHRGNMLDLVLSNVPLLVEVSLIHNGFLSVAFPQLSCCLSQLETLRLDSLRLDTHFIGLKFFEGINTLPALTSLKLLELEVNADSYYHHDFQRYSKLSRLATLIKASPHLQRLVLKLCFYTAEDRDTEYFDKRMPMKLEKAPKWPHHCLKVVEIIGYRGRPHIVEYVMDLVENAVALEKIVIDPIEPENWSCYHTIPDRRVEKSKKARDHAMHQLKRMVPSTIEFVCL